MKVNLKKISAKHHATCSDPWRRDDHEVSLESKNYINVNNQASRIYESKRVKDIPLEGSVLSRRSSYDVKRVRL